MNWFKEFWKRLTTPPNPARVYVPRPAIKSGAPSASPNLSNFSPRAQKAMELARKEADRLHHNYIGTEHLLLGMIALGQGTAFNVLVKMGVNPDTLRTEVEKQVSTGPKSVKADGFTPYTPRVKKVLRLAELEEKSLNHDLLSTGHILLGLLVEGGGAAALVLGRLNLDAEKVRAEVLKELSPEVVVRNFEGERDFGFFTPRLKLALGFAHKEAERIHDKFVGVEHVLAGLILLDNGVAVNVLKKAGLNLETVRGWIEKQHVPGGAEAEAGKEIPFTARAKEVFSGAAGEAKNLNHTYTGTEHMLLALLNEKEGAIVEIFKVAGVRAEDMRKEILRELTPPGTTSSGGVAQGQMGSCDQSMSNFTPRAQRTLALARKEADRFNHNFVGTEHLLLGLAALNQGTAVTVLGKMGVNLQTVRAEVEKQVGTGPDQKMIGNIPYTPRVKKVLALAAKEAKALNHTYVGTEHILLGLLREGDGVAARVLRNLDVDIEQTRQEILKELDPDYQIQQTSETGEPKTMITKSVPEAIDTTKRYDVYCRETSGKIVVYREALFKGVRSLLPRSEHDGSSPFVELERKDGSSVFIAKNSIVRFCLPGLKSEGEEI